MVGVTAHTHVSGEMVKPSMYNCLTLIKGGAEGEGGSVGAKSPVSKPKGAGGGGWIVQVVAGIRERKKKKTRL